MSQLQSDYSLNQHFEDLNFKQIQESDALDGMARLAAVICGTPVALISIMDVKKECMLATTGIDIDAIPRNQSVADYTIQEDKLLVIRDLSNDRRFEDCWFVRRETPLTFYAGMPLVGTNGHTLGTLSVLHHQPMALTRKQRSSLRDLAGEIVGRLEHHHNLQLLRETNTQKNELIRIVSHNLRNPIMGIISATDMMLTESELNVEEREEMLETIRNSGEQIYMMVNEYLDNNIQSFDRLEHSPEQTDPSAVIGELVALYQWYADIKNISIRLHREDDIPEVNMDKNNLYLIVGNVVSNSIKFTPRGGQVDVTLDYEKVNDEAGICTIRVKDEGIGIPDELNQSLFSYNSEGRKGTIGEPGYGLGLYIVKNLIDLSGGTISINSRVDEGTVVDIEIPAPESA